MANRFVLNTISYHGSGAIKEIPGALQRRGYKKIFVCSDPDLVKFGVTAKVTDELDAAGIAWSLYSEIKPNPTIQNVKDGVEAFKAAEALPEDTFSHQVAKKKTVKKLVNEKSKYIRSVKPLLDARRQLTEKENYAHLDDIRERYNDAKAHTDAEYEARRIEIERLEEERKADIERRKQERLA